MIRALSQRDKCRLGGISRRVTLLEMPLLATSPVYNTPRALHVMEPIGRVSDPRHDRGACTSQRSADKGTACKHMGDKVLTPPRRLLCLSRRLYFPVGTRR
jgi:hypothetical protein